MVWPVVAMVGIAAGGALLSYLESEKARKETSKQRGKIQDLVNKLQSPQFDTSMLTPPELKILETYTPEIVPVIYEAAPELAQLSERAQMGTKAQDAALARFQSISQGQGPGQNLEVIAALQGAIDQSGRQRDAIQSEMAGRGIKPSSSAYANLQYGTANQSQKNMFMTALQAALADRNRRDQATGQAAALGGNIAGFEMDLEKFNDNIINQVNMRNTQARRDYLANRANAVNTANRYNIERRQSVDDQNKNNLYGAQQDSRNLRNKQIQSNYDFEKDKTAIQAGISRDRIEDSRMNARDRIDLIQGLSNAGIGGLGMYQDSLNREADRAERAADREAYGYGRQSTRSYEPYTARNYYESEAMNYPMAPDSMNMTQPSYATPGMEFPWRQTQYSPRPPRDYWNPPRQYPGDGQGVYPWN